MASILPAPYLVADHKGVEVLNSIGAPYGEEVDWLQNGQELLYWMEAVGLLTASEFTQAQANLLPEDLDKAAQQVRALREVLRQNVPHSDAGFVAQLNEILASGPGNYTIRLDGDGVPQMQFKLRLQTVEGLVARVAAEVADLICLNEPGRLRQCDGPTCTYWFRDTTRNNRRRWCSMAVCGNRAKVKAHRQRG